MKTATCLILEASDFTKDDNLKKEAFSAFAKAELVIHEGRVIKTGAALVSSAPVAPLKRYPRKNVPQTAPDAPQRITAPLCVPPSDDPPSFDDISSES